MAKAKRTLVWLLAAVALVYVLDSALWQVRHATGTVTVDQFIATPLKGQRTGYDYAGPTDAPCARAVFPHAGMSPCWWLAHHRTQWE